MFLKDILIYLVIGSDSVRKILISLFVLLLLSGCKVKYKIDFEGNNIHESFDVLLNNDDKNSIEYLKTNDFYVSFNPEMVKYDKKIDIGKKFTNFNYTTHLFCRKLF